MTKRSSSFAVYVLAVCLAILLALFVTACGGSKEQQAPEDGEKAAAELPTVWPERCPLDGSGLQELPQGRPLAVMIGNNPQARPQEGLAKADLIYEFPAEGGITRFMAVYYHQEAEMIGPVRSARPYFMDQALGWDAVFVHVGQSPQSVAYYKANKVDHLDEFSKAKAFWRDKSRKAPDNLYTSTALLKEMLSELKWERTVKLEGFRFAEKPLSGKGAAALTIEINYPEKQNKAFFQYDAEKEVYLRFTGGKEHLDAVTGAQLTAKNVIVQLVGAKIFDQEGRMEVSSLGSGKILLFTDGRVVEGTWSKKELRQPTEFLTAQGQPLELNAGQTWIQIVPENTKITY